LFAAWRGRGRRRALYAGSAVALVAVMWGEGALVMRGAGKAPQLELALIQGNIGHEIKFKREFRLPNMRRMIVLSKAAIAGMAAAHGDAAAQGDSTSAPAVATGAALDTLVAGTPGDRLDLIVWAETAAPCYFRHETLCRDLVHDFVDDSGIPLFTGFPDLEFIEGDETLKWNAAGLFLPGEGLVGRYDKVNLVPFGEAIPYQERFTRLKSIDFGEADFSRGRGFYPLHFAPGDFGVMICFESIFPEAGRQAARRGARFFINITNDEWFGRSAGPYQHAAMAVVRSIECRRGLARCANTGVSFFVDRYGRTTPMTPLYVPRIVYGRVELGDGTTPYMRIGDLVPRLCLAAALVIGLAGWRRPARPALHAPRG
jgi:apolipoprotein N-acyltransferase